MIKRYYPDRSGLFQDVPAPNFRAGGLTEWLANVLQSDRISTRLNTYGRYWTDMLDSALYYHHQNQIFKRTMFIPAVQFQRLVESRPRGTEAVQLARGGPIPSVVPSFVTCLYM